MVVDGTLTMGQVRPLIGNKDCVMLAREVAAKGLSARQVEALVARDRASSGKTASKPSKMAGKSADIRALEARAETILGLRLDIDWNEESGKGRMAMTFKSLEQFEAVMEKLGID